MNKSHAQGRNLIRWDYSQEPPLYNMVIDPINWNMVRAGTSVIGWRDLIKNGMDASSNFSLTTNHVASSPGHLICAFFRNADFPEDIVACSGDIVPWADFPDASLLSSVTADNQAYRNLLKKIREDRTQFSGQIFLGEMREAYHMLRHPAQALRQGLSAYLGQLKLNKLAARRNKSSRHSDVSRFDNRFNDVSRPQAVLAKTWLEASFGWQPFVNDIQDAVKAIKRIGEQRARRGISGNGVSEASTPFGTGVIGPFSFFRVKYERNQIDTITVRYKAGLIADWDSHTSAIDRLLQLGGFNWQEFIPTAWELLPWSFLIDYFTNIGDILEYGATSTQNVQYVVKTTRRESNLKTHQILDVESMQSLLGSNFVYAYGDPGHSELKHFILQRVRVTELNCPAFQLEIPGISTKWVNMGSLLLGAKALVPYR